MRTKYTPRLFPLTKVLQSCIIIIIKIKAIQPLRNKEYKILKMYRTLKKKGKQKK